MKVYYLTVLDPEGYPKVQHRVAREPPTPKEPWPMTHPELTEFCCEDMKKLWDTTAVQLMDKKYQEDRGAAVGIVEDVTGWDEICCDRVAIRHCPWCGASIEVVEKERVRVVRTKSVVNKPVEEVSVTEVREP